MIICNMYSKYIFLTVKLIVKENFGAITFHTWGFTAANKVYDKVN